MAPRVHAKQRGTGGGTAREEDGGHAGAATGMLDVGAVAALGVDATCVDAVVAAASEKPPASDASPSAEPSRMSITYGYARVSSKDQSLARQLDALYAFPVREGRIYMDKATGGNFERPGYRRLVRKLREGDTVVIKSIDRLGRNYTEILNEWRRLTQEKGAAIVVLDMPLLDTRVSTGDVTGIFIADLMLQLLSYIAEVERENTRRRQAEGIAAAQRRGVRFGRPCKPRPECYERLRDDYLAGRISRKQAASKCDVCVNTFDKWRRMDEE